MFSGNAFVYSWSIDSNELERTIMRLYCLGEKDQNICLIIEDFTPYVYCQLPEHIHWDENLGKVLGEKIDQLCGEKSPIKKQIFYKHRLFYAENNDSESKEPQRKKYPYLYCSFNHQEDIRFFVRKLYRPIFVGGIGNIQLKVHEDNASPILQLTSVKKLPTAGWLSFTGKKTKEKITYCDEEYIVKWKTGIEANENIKRMPKPLLMGWDIETNSSDDNRFPQASIPEDKVFQISVVCLRQSEDDLNCEKYLLSLGDPDEKMIDAEVRRFKTEHDLLLGFTALIREKNPNIMIGFNIFGFDIPYLNARAQLLLCIYDFDRQGMLIQQHCPMKEISWSSSARKNQDFRYYDMEGRISVDLLPMIRMSVSLGNYDLKSVSLYYLKDQSKDPLNAKGIFRCYRVGLKGGERGRKALGIVGKYAVQDSFLVVKLFETRTDWYALCEMSKITNVPIFSLYTQGQQIKVFSEVYKKCTHDNIVVERNGYTCAENERYMGATVFPPIPGLHDYVVSFDFSSLYPSAIIAYNISWDTLVRDDSIPDEKCHVMIWEEHFSCPHDPNEIQRLKLIDIIKEKEAKVKEVRKERDKRENKSQKEEFKEKIAKMLKKIKPFRDEKNALQKSKAKIPVCAKRKFRFLKEPRGVLPEILTYLLGTRSATKKEMKKIEEKLKETKDEDSQEYIDLDTYRDVLDQRQLALKICANSVVGDSAVPCKIDGKFCYRPIEELSLGDWKIDEYGNEIATPIHNLLVWSDVGFTEVEYIFRHVLSGSVERIVTAGGIVDCTEDHSLLRPNGTEIKPSELEIGDELMLFSVPLPDDTPKIPLYQTISDGTIENFVLNNTQEEEAFIFGLFFAEGTAGLWGDPLRPKSSWIIYNADLALLERAKKILEKIEERKFEIKDYRTSCGVYHLKPCVKIVDIVRKYRKFFYSNRRMKKIPDEILNSPLNIRQSFFMGYYSGDGSRKMNIGVRINNKGSIGSAGLWFLAKSLGYKVTINNYKNDNIYTIQCSVKSKTLRKNIVKNTKYAILEKNISPLMIPVVKNGELITVSEGKSMYRNIEISCERNPRKKLLDSLDRSIGILQERNAYAVKYDTYTKKIIYKKYCCGKEILIGQRTLQKNLPEKNASRCKCEISVEHERKNERKIYAEKEEKTYVYDIETKSHHFATGVGDMIVHNSAYGAMGVRKGYLPFMPGAMCTTYMGRKAIELTAKTIQEKYKGKLIYGDTDSNYVSFPHLNSASECWDFSFKVAEEITKLYPKPMALLFEEKVFRKYLLLTKKRYMYLACKRDGEVDTKIGKKGVMLQRRDNCPVARKIYSDVIMLIFNREERVKVESLVLDEFNKLCSHFYPMNEFIITKSVGSIGDLMEKDFAGPKPAKDKYGKDCWKIGDYTIKPLPTDKDARERKFVLKKCDTEQEYYLRCMPAQVQLAEKMKERGQYVSAGSRLEYVLVDNGDSKAKQYEKIESVEYFKNHSGVLNLDLLYYLKQLTNPIDQILNISFAGKADENKFIFPQDFCLKQLKIRLQRAKVLKQLLKYFEPVIIVSEK